MKAPSVVTLLVSSLLLPATSFADHEHRRPRDVGPLRQVSRLSPFGPLENCGNFPSGPGVNFLNSEVEPYVVVNPTDERNIVAFWQQDRWSNGGARGNVAGVTHNRGRHWEIIPVPGLSECSGGPFERASDPWLAFSPDGTLHQISLVFSGQIGAPGNRNGLAVSRSEDGGLTWSDPILIIDDVNSFSFNDKQSMTADPNDSDFLYAVWDRLTFFSPTSAIGPAYFARTTDGGQTWDAARPIFDPGVNNQTIGNLLVVLPNGKLINFFSELLFVDADGNPLPIPVFNISFVSSEDRGLTWTPDSSVVVSRFPPVGAVTPDAMTPVRDAAIIFDAAVDPRRGTIYVVWQGQGTAGPNIFLSLSKDEGETWSDPIQVNQTPENEANPLRAQAFIPQVRVTRNGTVGVLYYDFRNDDESAELADVFLVRCRGRCDRARRWRREVRLTKRSFDYSQAPATGTPPTALFLGDYVGLAAGRRDFTTLFAQSFDMFDPASGFFRQVGRRGRR